MFYKVQEKNIVLRVTEVEIAVVAMKRGKSVRVDNTLTEFGQAV